MNIEPQLSSLQSDAVLLRHNGKSIKNNIHVKNSYRKKEKKKITVTELIQNTDS